MAQTLDQLEEKYRPAIALAQSSGHLQNVNMEGERLFIRAEVATQEIKNSIWNLIKSIDPQYNDLIADISLNPSLPQPRSQTQAAAASGSAPRTYTVQPGDTLSAIAQRFYGNASNYNKIFQANRDKLTDADHIRPGQELVIPS